MALIKQKNSKGVTVEYWQIYKQDYNKDNNTTLSRMRAYVSKDVRTNSIGNSVPMFNEVRSFDGEMSVEEAYGAWKNPILVDVEDEEGNPTYEEDGKTKVQEDTNFFTDAKDDI